MNTPSPSRQASGPRIVRTPLNGFTVWLSLLCWAVMIACTIYAVKLWVMS
jgi:hypothetical protein